ncbi:MAG: M23 family metallopeptidase, partial [Chloroflexota bacterium]|nr:M23 family metallopeptidase [Chloroflexota bacterium]
EVGSGQWDVQAGAERLLEATIQTYMDQARAARATGLPLPWPFVENDTHLAVQRLAVRYWGHTLAAPEVEGLLRGVGDDLATLEMMLQQSQEATLYSEARQRVDEGLQRSARGLPLYGHEVAGVVQPVLAPYDLQWLGRREMRRIQGDLEAYLRRLPEFRALHGDLFFAANPLDPMPRLGQPFGVPVSYQPDGYHTGIDLRGQRVGGQQPPLYAVADGIVAHVGPIYCLGEEVCRGPYAIILDHGNNIYSIYSHNSEATVEPGQPVTAGQMIGRQGSEGYSRGPHLHLEVHVGAPYSGDWTDPWHGGQFVDPWPWLPREGLS